MKLSEAITHRIMNDAVGQSVGRDEHGLFVKWDGLQIECKTGTVSLWLNTTKVSDQILLSQNIDVSSGVVLRINGLEGRLRIEAK